MTRSRLRALATAAMVALLARAAPAPAHPLGNFTVNRYARLEPRAGGLAVLYVVDFAEIPTLQELAAFPALEQDLDPAALERAPDAKPLAVALAGRFARGLTITMNGRAAPLDLRAQALAFVGGTGAAPTMRLRLDLVAAWPGVLPLDVAYADANAPERLGWRELVLRPAPGVALADATIGSADRSAELTHYPTDPGANFPQETSGGFRLTSLAGTEGGGTAASAHAPSVLGGATGRPGGAAADRLVALVTKTSERGLTLPLGLAALLAAAALGAGHALSPGHGKTIVGAYLVGTRSRSMDAVFLGAIVTITHTAGVFALGFAALFASRYVVPERLYPWLGVVSGALVALLGAAMLHERIERAIGITAPHRHLFWTHAHTPLEAATGGASAGEGGASAERARSPVTRRSLAALGVSGGLVPCPSAIVVLLTAVALHRVGFGLLLILAFSMGLASVLIAIGLLFVHARRFASHLPAGGGILLKTLPIVSAILVALFGIGIAVQSLVAGGLLAFPR